MAKFRCDKCGICCTKLNQNKIYSSLDRGDGVCKYFDSESKICNIYESRPVLCNVEKSYDIFFRDMFSRETFYQYNRNACLELHKENN